ncbi:Uncharacterised protein [Vibrio cholerae]|nr:Uncharacterised protein [Vibrio cholerae]
MTVGFWDRAKRHSLVKQTSRHCAKKSAIFMWRITPTHGARHSMKLM